MMTNIKKTVIAAILTALCVILPMAFHAIPNAGILISPMHIPAFIAGLTIGPLYGLIVGLLGPFLSSMLTGMPAVSVMPQMMIELASYAFFAGLFMRLIRTYNYMADIYLSLSLSMIAGRAVAGICRALLFSSSSYSFNAWLASYFVSTWPAIIVQLAIIPAIVFALEKANLIEKRY